MCLITFRLQNSFLQFPKMNLFFYNFNSELCVHSNTIYLFVLTLFMRFFTFNLSGFQGRIISFIIVLFALLYAEATFPQSFQNLQNLKFQSIENAGGLANNRINNIIKDHDGFVWFATENGVARFDGNDVKGYFYDQKDSSSLYGNFVVSFLLDKNNQLWIGTDLGLVVYNKLCDNFRRIKADVPNESRHYILDIDLLENNTVIALTTSRILYYDSTSASLKQYFSIDDTKEINRSEGFSQFFINPSTGDLWITTQNKFIIAEYPSMKFRFLNHSCGLVRNVYLHGEKQLWIASQQGLFTMNLTTEKISRFLPVEKEYQGYFMQEIRDILIDGAENYWIATDQSGLICYHTAMSRCIRFSHKEYDNQSLNNNLIRKVFIDNSGILWVGTQYEGINYTLLRNPKEFILYMHIPEQSNSISSNVVTAMMKDKDGNLWIGSDGGGVNIIDNTSGKISKLLYDKNNPVSISTNAVLAIYQDSRDNIWIGGYNGEICRYNPYSREWKRYRNICKHADCNSLHDVRQFLEDSKHRIWIATNGHGIFMFNYDNEQFEYFNALNGEIIDDYVLSLCESADQNLWVGTYNGACLFNPDKKTRINFDYSEFSASGLSNNWIYCIHRDSKNRIWLGTTFGLNLYNPGTATFTKFYVGDGLPGNVIDGILEDEEGNLWISTNNGISKFNPDSLKFLNFYQKDGLPGNEFNHGSYYKSRDGELFFGSNFGMVSFYPSKINPDRNVSPVVIRDVLVFFRSIGKENWCDINQQESGEKKIVLSYKQSTVTFNYTALNFINTHNNKFSYILEGYEQQWNQVGNRREATYINLRPGNYTFRVTGCNNDGICDSKGDSMLLVIRPPWWGTSYFRYSLAIFLFLSIFGLYHWRVNIVIKQKEKLESLVQQRTLELREKNSELDELNKMNKRIFSIIAHDLKSPFNSIMGFIELLAKKYTGPEDESKKKYIGYVQSSLKKIFVLMENLLLWSSSHLTGSAIKPVEYSINEQVIKNIELAHDGALHKSVSISFDPDKDYKVKADYNMIDAVIRNLLSNAIKFSHPEGEITFALKAENDMIICSVIDRGLGMDKEEIHHLFSLDTKKLKIGTNGELGSGLGLVICYDLIVRNHGKIWIDSEPGKGSVFNFAVPAATL
jgi:ligand-binding sensor domain-containing protein/signal transduction histidine kinase